MTGAGTRPGMSLEKNTGLHVVSGDQAKDKEGGNTDARDWDGIKGDARGGG